MRRQLGWYLIRDTVAICPMIVAMRADGRRHDYGCRIVRGHYHVVRIMRRHYNMGRHYPGVTTTCGVTTTGGTYAVPLRTQ